MFDIVASAPTSSGASGIGGLLAREAAAPANCWSFTAKGTIEGVLLDLHHPNVDGPALIMGEGVWVLRDKRFKQGALYQRNGQYGHMRRASLSEIMPQSNKPFYVFSMLEGSAPYSIVHVDGDLPGVKPKIELFSGIRGNAVMRASYSEGLYRLTEREPIVVFRKDGSVVELTYNDGKEPLAVVCDRATALIERLSFIQLMLEQAAAMTDQDKMCRREDWLCYNLIAMLEALLWVRDIDDRNESQSKIVDLLVDLNDEGMLRKGVRRRLADVLDRCTDTVRWRFHSWQSLDKEDKPLSADQQRKRQDRLAKQAHTLQARAEANRSHVKGPSPAADKQGRKGKRKN
ncbi:MAG TPA: hypothetical protein VG984_03100 [Candidatus Paceibacterota bacterium]|nr:hypothetical protein [Candidatus Paceibacterota bacterium]